MRRTGSREGAKGGKFPRVRNFVRVNNPRYKGLRTTPTHGLDNYLKTTYVVPKEPFGSAQDKLRD